MERAVHLAETDAKNIYSVDILCAVQEFENIWKNTSLEVSKNCWNHTKILTPSALTVNVPETTDQQEVMNRCINELVAQRSRMFMKKGFESCLGE